jgi:hypothetical protein
MTPFEAHFRRSSVQIQDMIVYSHVVGLIKCFKPKFAWTITYSIVDAMGSSQTVHYNRIIPYFRHLVDSDHVDRETIRLKTLSAGSMNAPDMLDLLWVRVLVLVSRRVVGNSLPI